MCEVVKGIYNAGKEEGREEMRAERYSESLARAEALSDKIPDDLLSQATGVSQKDINVLRKKGKLILFKITNTCDVMSQVFRKDQGSAAY